MLAQQQQQSQYTTPNQLLEVQKPDPKNQAPVLSQSLPNCPQANMDFIFIEPATYEAKAALAHAIITM
jgi:hypothetical protein